MSPSLAFEPLSPVPFLDRTAMVFPQHTLASALASLANGRPVAVLGPHYARHGGGASRDPLGGSAAGHNQQFPQSKVPGDHA